MYCNTCRCEYSGWSVKCPSCGQRLQEGLPVQEISNNGQLNYTSLVEWIQKEGNVVEIHLKASQVSRKKSTRFPYMGFGYAWAQSMHGNKDKINVELVTSEVGKDRKWSFPYKGHGFAWQQEVQGLISGNPCLLNASYVERKKTWRFPFFGYGYAWTEEMQGVCGERIEIEMKTVQVKRKSNWRFPHFGFGYAWVEECVLTLRSI